MPLDKLTEKLANLQTLRRVCKEIGGLLGQREAGADYGSETRPGLNLQDNLAG